MWRRIKRWLMVAALVSVITPIFCILMLRWVDPPTTAFIMRHNFDVAVSDQGVYAKHTWADWSEISAHIPVAVLAAEDQRFPHHFGIDFTEIGRALLSDSDHRRGASTISQQVAKNIFLWSGRSYIRKIFEAGIALALEALLSKQRILEIYLNIAQTGVNHFGVSEASWEYFNKPPGQIDRNEAARIAAILPNPSKYSASKPSEHILKRQQWILKQMKQLGGIELLNSLKRTSVN